jgi:tetratricopeptide (TPR) repeat protein
MYYGIVSQDFEKALEAFNMLVDKYPADSVAQNNVAVAAFYLMDYERASIAGRNLVSRYPDNVGFKYNQAAYAVYASEFDEARLLARDILSDDPNHSGAAIIDAHIDALNGNIAAAEEVYRQLGTVALPNLADLQIYKGELDNSIATLNEVIELDLSRDANTSATSNRLMLAEALARQGSRTKALEILGQSLGDAEGGNLVHAAMILVQVGETERALEIAQTLSLDLSKMLRAYADVIKAYVASEQGNLLDAVEYSASAISALDLWLARFVLGNAYLKAGHPAEAFSELQICKDRIGEITGVYNNNVVALRIVADLELAINEATDLLANVVESRPLNPRVSD